MPATKMHMSRGAPMGLGTLLGLWLVRWKRATLCGKYLRLELTTEDWAKVDCKMCLKVKGARL